MPLRKFQEGGAVAAGFDPDDPSNAPIANYDPTDPDSLAGPLSPAAAYLLTQSIKPSQEEQRIVGEMGKSAEDVRAALKAYRARIQAQKYNPAEKWFSIAAGLGKPTRTGAFGETMANLGEELQGYTGREGAYERGKEDQLGKLDLAIAQTNDPLLQAQLQLEKIREAQKARIAASILRPGRQTNIRWLDSGTEMIPTDPQTGQELPGVARIKKNKLEEPPMLDPQTIQDAATLVMLDPSRIRDYASYTQKADRAAIQNAVTQRLKDSGMTAEDLAQIRTNAHAQQLSIQKMVAQQNAVQQFEGLAKYNGERLMELIDKIDDTSVPFLEGITRHLKKGVGSVDAAEAASVLRTFQTEVARIIGNPNMTGVLSDNARNEAADMIAGNLSAAATRRVVNRLFNEFDMRQRLLQEQIESARGSMTSGVRPRAAPAPAQGGLTPDEEAEVEQLKQEQQPQRARGGRIRYDEGGVVKVLKSGKKVRIAPDGTVTVLPPDAPTDDNTPPAAAPPGGGGSDQVSDLRNSAAQLIGAGAAGAGVGAALPGLGGSGLTPAEKNLAGTFKTEEVDPTAALGELERIQRTGVPATLMTDPSMRGLAEKAIKNASPELQRATIEDLENQTDTARGRVEGQLTTALNPAGSYFVQRKTLTDNLYNNSRPLYEALYKKYPGVVESPEISAILDTDAGKAAVAKAAELMDIQGLPIGKADITGMVRKPSLQFLDYVKRGMDEMVEQAEPNGVPSTRGHALRDMRTRFRDALDAAAPDDYKNARKQYAGDLEVRDALEQGRQFNKFQPEELALRAQGMSAAEKSAFRTGQMQRLMEVIENPATTADMARKIVGSPRMMASLKPFIDNPQAFDVLRTALQQEVELFAGGRDLVTSARAAQLARQRAGQKSGLRTAAEEALKFDITSPLAWATKILNSVPEMSTKDAAQTIALLQTSNPASIAALSSRLKTAGSRKLTGKRAAAAGIGALGAAGADYLYNQFKDQQP